MRKLFAITLLAAVLAGCGETKPPEPAPTATAAAKREDPDLAGYSQGVKDYYAEIHTAPTGDEDVDIEAEYHQPPRPAEAGVGDTITLTGTNMGVRLQVTVTEVKTSGGDVDVHLELENTGITVYDAPLEQAALTVAGGATVPVAGGCSRGFDPEAVRIDVGRTKTGCLRFAATQAPERLQLALEIVPTTAGGIWRL